MGMIMVGIIFIFMVMARKRIMVIIMVVGKSCYYSHQDYLWSSIKSKNRIVGHVKDHGDDRYLL
jgi:hypothetical protein